MAPTRADYAKIHIAIKELNLDKEQLLSDRYGVDSAKKLKPAQLRDLYAHFKRLGWKPKRKKNSKTSPKYDHAVQRKIVAMWIGLAAAGVLRDSSDKALQTWVKKMTGVTNLKWCDGQQCHKMVEALKQWGERYNVQF